MINFKTMQEITEGVAYISQKNGSLQFHRFTPDEEEYYDEKYKGTAWPRHYATSGVKLSFTTNSTTLAFKVNVESVTPTNYFSHDIICNGTLIGHVRNFTVGKPVAEDPHPFGRFEGQFDLGEGEKEITIVFPWSANSMLEDLTLDEGAFIAPCEKKTKNAYLWRLDHLRCIGCLSIKPPLLQAFRSTRCR